MTRNILWKITTMTTDYDLDENMWPRHMLSKIFKNTCYSYDCKYFVKNPFIDILQQIWIIAVIAAIMIASDAGSIRGDTIQFAAGGRHFSCHT